MPVLPAAFLLGLVLTAVYFGLQIVFAVWP